MTLQRSATAEGFHETFFMEVSRGVIEVQYIDLLVLIMAGGDVPSDFTNAVAEQFADGLNSIGQSANGSNPDAPEFKIETDADKIEPELPIWSNFVANVVREAVVWPEIVDVVTDRKNQVTIKAFSLEDRFKIFGMVVGDAAQKKV